MLRRLALLPSIQIVAGLQGLPLLESLLTPLTLFKLQNLEIWRCEGSESLLKVGQTTVSTLERILCPGLDLNPPGLQFTSSLRRIPHRLPILPSTAWGCRQQRWKLGTCLVPRITPRLYHGPQGPHPPIFPLISLCYSRTNRLLLQQSGSFSPQDLCT